MTEKRLCQLLYSGLGGHASVAFSLLAADTQKQFKHSMLFYGIEPLLDRYRQEVSAAGIPFDAIQKQPGLDLKSWKTVYETLCRLQPQVVILHSTNLILPVAKYCRQHGAQLIAVEHTAMAAKQRIEHLYTRLCRNKADKIVLLTETYRTDYLQKYGTRQQAKIQVIPNGIDTGFFVPSDAPKPVVPVISMVGRFSPQKDQLTVIKAVEQLAVPVLLKLAGSGEGLEMCRRYVSQHGLAEKVCFTGVLNEFEIRDLLQESTVYVQSSFEENMPTSVLQAMACGIPVIGTAIPGIRNLIAMESDGWLVPAGDENSLAAQLSIVLANTEQLTQTGKRARLKAESLFSHTRMLQAYAQLINNG